MMSTGNSPGVSANLLNMNGTLTRITNSTASANFAGTVTAPAGLTGQLYGYFYGPSATEVGGNFALKGTGVQTYFGAFGAKR